MNTLYVTDLKSTAVYKNIAKNITGNMAAYKV